MVISKDQWRFEMLKIDLHIHTIHSGHAYGTVYDMLKEAKSHKMDMVAITDHGPSLLGSASKIHFSMGPRFPKSYDRMDVLFGCEANVINEKGEIDLNEKTIRKLDILLVGLHDNTPYKDLGEGKNTKAMMNCFKKYPILVFVHPTTISYEYNINEVVQAACDNNILVELNLCALQRTKIKHEKEKGLESMKEMVEIVRKNNKKLIVNSDAHFFNELGDYSLLKEYWNELELTNEIIINNYPDELKLFIESKNLKDYKENAN